MNNVNLFGKDKKGGYKVWGIEVMAYVCPVDDTPNVCLSIRHGKEGGKEIIKQEFFATGKQGRTPYEQAVSEAQAKVKKQIDKNYRHTKDELDEVPLLAMLAGDYNKIGHRIDYSSGYGVDVSDKFDGLRVLAKCTISPALGIKKVTLESRTGQAYNVPHLEDELLRIMKAGDVLDGEVYFHTEMLQDIKSAVSRTDTEAKIDAALRKVEKTRKAIQKAYLGMGEHPDEEYDFETALGELEEAVHIHRLRPLLEFHVFDIPSTKLWDERLYDLGNYAQSFNREDGLVKEVEYKKAWGETQMKEHHKDAVSRGFEGVMIRNEFGAYESGKRSADIQKYKEFVDSEFLILDIIPAKDEGSVYILKNDINDGEFRCTFGNMPDRALALTEKHLRIGKWMTVQYQTRLKKTLLPQFGTGKLIREGKVINGEFVPSE